MILTGCFHNFDLAIIKRGLSPVCSNYVSDRLCKVETIPLVIIVFILDSGLLSVGNDRLRDLVQGFAIVEYMRSTFSAEQSLDLRRIRQMAID